jgi:hypothetical protein
LYYFETIMPVVTVEISGADQIIKNLKSFPQKSAQVYGEAVDTAAAKYRDSVKKLPAVSAATTGYDAKGIPVVTGRLRGSIRKKRLSLLAAGVGPGVNYGVHVHEGTSRMPDRPFLRWALELGALQMIDRIFKTASQKLP